MKKTFLLSLAVAMATLYQSTLNAAALNIGDAAPALKASKWVKGGEVALDTNQTYVVEFWATWCGPCRASIPHLTELAHKFKDQVTFIGMDVWENGGDQAAKEKAVDKFVTSMGDNMDYHVAMDDGTFMADNWMKAADQNGIPCAFVISKSKILWIGHPMAGLEETLADVVAGKFDMERAKKRIAAQEKLEAFYQLAMKGGDDAEIQKQAAELEALDKEVGGLTPGEKFDAQKIIAQARFQSAMIAYQKALFSTNDADAAKLPDLEAAAAKAVPEGVDFAKIKKQLVAYHDNAAAMKAVQEVYAKYTAAVGEAGDTNQAATLAPAFEAAALKTKNPQMLNEFAWALLTDESIKQRDIPLATRLAKAAVDASDSSEPSILDTYARALFDGGKTADAIAWQKKAIAASTDDAEKKDLTATLEKYQQQAGTKTE